jgi:hypothetical protein
MDIVETNQMTSYTGDDIAPELAKLKQQQGADNEQEENQRGDKDENVAEGNEVPQKKGGEINKNVSSTGNDLWENFKSNAKDISVWEKILKNILWGPDDPRFMKFSVLDNPISWLLGGEVSSTAKGLMTLWPAAKDGKTVINGIEYSIHALERMQPVGTIMKGTEMFSRGVPPSVVENVIKFGKVTPGNSAAEVVRTFENVRVITNPEGTRVISVIKLGH